MSSFEYTTKRNALLVGYYIKEQLGYEPTVEKIDHILNQPNIDEILSNLESLLTPAQKFRIDTETKLAMN